LAHAVELLRAEQLDDAEALLARIRDAAPDDPGALHFQGVLRHAQGRTGEGIALIRASLARFESQAGAWNNLGNLLVHAQQFDDAAQAYEASVRHADAGEAGSDAAADALNNIAILQRRHGRWPESEQAARRAIALRPGFGDAWYNLSLALMGQRRVHDGLIASSRAIALWPRQTLGRSQVIRALTLLGERAQAAQLYREWLAEEPGNPVVQHMLAACEGAPATTPPRASDAYVENVFDAYAESFDASLERLHYRAPELIAHELERRLGAPRAALAIVDAGCGTGLCAPLARGLYLGVDTALVSLTFAQRRFGDAQRHFALMSAGAMAVAPASFDKCAVVNVAHHLDADALDTLLTDVQRAVRGPVVLVDPAPDVGNALELAILRHDRGEYVRPRAALRALLTRRYDIEHEETFHNHLHILPQVLFRLRPRERS